MDAQTEMFFDELVRKQQAEIARLTAEVYRYGLIMKNLPKLETLEAENAKLRAALEQLMTDYAAHTTKLRTALEQIVATERDDDSICAADRCASIARAALASEQDK